MSLMDDLFQDDLRPIDRERVYRLMLAAFDNDPRVFVQVLTDIAEDDTVPVRVTPILNTIHILTRHLREAWTNYYGADDARERVNDALLESLRKDEQ